MADTVAGHAVVDIADGGQVHAAVETAVNAYGRLDILINNAGIVGPPTAALAYPEDAWRQVVDIDLLASGQSDCTFDAVLQFAHIARPRVGHKSVGSRMR